MAAHRIPKYVISDQISPSPRWFAASSDTILLVHEACQGAVDDQARYLATMWGLLGSSDADPVSNSTESRGDKAAGLDPGSAPGPEKGVHKVGGVGHPGVSGKEGWAPLWEALGVLSVPRVTLGAGEIRRVPALAYRSRVLDSRQS